MALAANFDCSLLFDFPCSGQKFGSKCQWIDAKTIFAVVGTKDSCASPGSTLKIASGIQIKAACPGTSVDVLASCRSWLDMDTAQVMTILPPFQPALPSIVLSMPTTISSCSSLLVDATSSIGHGGRQWKDVRLSVIARGIDSTGPENANATELLSKFLKDNFLVAPPMRILSRYWIADNSYSFTLTMCNFLGVCSQTTNSIWISSDTVLSLIVPGSPNRTLSSPGQSLTL